MAIAVTREIKRPRSDDRVLWEISQGIFGYQAVLVAHDLRLFSCLDKPLSIAEICSSLNIQQRPAEAILSACVSLGLLQVRDSKYSLTPVSEDYLLESSPTYFGKFLDFVSIQNRDLYSFDKVKNAVISNSPQVYGSGDLFKSHEDQAALARSFTDIMHGHSIGPATGWPNKINLAQHKVMLDVGGGSGAHTIGALQQWSNLQGIVFDMAPVCDVAEEYIARYELQDRARSHVGDMWNDDFPAADIHFYADIFHDWSPEKCRLLTQKSYDSLESGGRIIIHELLFNDDKSGPFPAASYSVGMLLWTEGQQYSGQELSAMLIQAGFIDIEVTPSFGYWSIVSGRKP